MIWLSILTCFGSVFTDTIAASVSSRRKRSNLKLLLRYNSLSSQLRLRHKRRVKILVFTRDLKINYGTHTHESKVG